MTEVCPICGDSVPDLAEHLRKSFKGGLTEIRTCPRCKKTIVYFGLGTWWHLDTLEEACETSSET